MSDELIDTYIYNIGEKVRVLSSNKDISRIGIISYKNDNLTYDIIYENNEEINNIHCNSIKPLESFELIPLNKKLSPLEIKDEGNILFNLKDYDSAISYYKYSLNLLTNQSISIGSDVLLLSNDQITYLPAFVLLIDDNICEIDCNDINITIAMNELVLLVSKDKQLNDRLLQRSLYINLSRCYLKKSLYGWAIKWCSLAIGVRLSLQDVLSDDILLKYSDDEYYIRSKAFLLSSRPGYAIKDANKLSDKKKAESLINEISLFVRKRKSDNKKLVKSLMTWVDKAMQSNSESDYQLNLLNDEK